MGCSCKDLEARVKVIEDYHNSIEYHDFKELIELLKEVKAGLRFFSKLSKFIKWLSGTLLAISGIAWVLKHFGQAS